MKVFYNTHVRTLEVRLRRVAVDFRTLVNIITPQDRRIHLFTRIHMPCLEEVIMRGKRFQEHRTMLLERLLPFQMSVLD